jgi:hypothetical protein
MQQELGYEWVVGGNQEQGQYPRLHVSWNAKKISRLCWNGGRSDGERFGTGQETQNAAGRDAEQLRGDGRVSLIAQSGMILASVEMMWWSA